jgi:inhibitor of KinA sporulation pathway (predicted exonuclease)
MKISKNINIIDVEATCWNDEQERNGQPNEVIEIGIAEVDLELADPIRQTSTIYIIPENSTISDFCTELTGITEETIKKHGISFNDAITKLKQEYRIHKRHWVSWGDYDKHQLKADCDRHNLVFNRVFFKRHTNLKTMFGLLYGLPRELGVQEALKSLELNFIGIPHSGKDDAYNIARLFKNTLGRFRNGNGTI